MSIKSEFSNYTKNVQKHLNDWEVLEIMKTFPSSAGAEVAGRLCAESFIDDDSSYRCALHIAAQFLIAEKKLKQIKALLNLIPITEDDDKVIH